MKLTGKCKQSFKKWYNYNYCGNDGCEINYNSFLLLNSSFQYGVYVDFFDSVGISVDIQPVLDYNEKHYTKFWYFLVNVNMFNKDIDYSHIKSSSRQKAREKAIEKANEIFNY